MRKKYHRFLQRNRDKGIPNLMLYLCIINAVLYLFTFLTKNMDLYQFLRFDYEKLMNGQVWRIFTWIFSYGMESHSYDFMGLIYIFFYIMFNNWLGQILESVWGTFRLNLYYFGGALLTGIVAALILVIWGIPVHVSAYYLNLSLMLAVATLIPEERIMLFGIFPLKMRWLAIFDIVLILLDVIKVVALLSGTILWMMLVMVATAPLISILNYVFNFGRDVGRLFSTSFSYRQIKRKREFKKAARPNPNWAGNYRSKTGEKPYRHKCTVCGRTDTDNPNLEFRYCSRCKGYFCYCIDHINQHTHIE